MKHNHDAILSHPLANRIEMIEGSSISRDVIQKVYNFAKNGNKILVCLDSNHTHEHVLAELHAYAHLVSLDSYCVVFDTVIEDIPGYLSDDRPWGPGNSPKSAVHEFLKSHPEFMIDKKINDKILISVAPDGYLKKIK